ncbi:ABC transporter permease [Aliidongia dinghuensis]|uniref:ABC transporter permease n=1 Tax=Aliidongia dinghuensis TaxID=1867774 RepID=A0A8J2Z0K1_9PROT|nr:ABC transporter substrate-binding protein [Aliidongia dinghuensis]GGF45288.1 ABC transporter permease [Aliidongia dinghuensis]
MLAGLTAQSALAEVPGSLVKIGVLTDLSGPFADQVGQGSVAAANLAAEDFAKEAGGLKVEILSADHQNKPDIGVSIARRWIDEDGVAAVVDLPNSGVALGVAEALREKHRTALASSSASSDLTGKACAPTTVQWVTDTWSQGHSTAHALAAQGAKSWFFLTVDYALGKTLERDATEALTAEGGEVRGAARHPLGTPDLSAMLLQAQSSGAKVLALADTGADAINAIKQAGEFGISGQMQLAALFLQISDIQTLGLAAAQGLLLTEAFYWDQNAATRDWSRRFAARMGGRMPTMDQAGVYSATLAYLRAVRTVRSIDGETVVKEMKRAPIDDPLFGRVAIRPDGRAVHDMYLYRVKKPSQSRGPWDDYELVGTIPAAEAFRPANEGGCTLAP